MPSRQGPVHVATTTRKYKGKVYRTHLLRRTFREGGKIRHQTLGNLSHLPDELIAFIRQALRGEATVPTATWEIVRSLPHGHVAAVLGVLRDIGLDTVLAARPSRQRALAVAMIVARILSPGSKLATARGFSQETATSSLAETLDLEAVDEDELYATLDWLVAQQPRVETRLANKHLKDGTLVLYDVSGSYYTGRRSQLARFGYCRDGKRGFTQVVYGLLCGADGCPVAVEVFPGNTADPTTLGSQIAKIRQRFGVRRVVMVGDRGTLTSQRIDAELREVEGLDWISALRSEGIRKLVNTSAIQMSLFDERDLAEITSSEFPGERLIACRNPFLADERARKREELLQATERELDRIVAATCRATRPLRGKDKLALRVGKVINKFKMGKHLVLEISEDAFRYHRDEEKIAAEAALDGIYVIRTSVPAETLSAENTVRAYKQLSKVERAFRAMKTVDLKVRPIYHWLDDRIRGHVFLCMLAYYVEWHMRQRLAPLLFDDHDREAAEAKRGSVVAPAPRSQAAKAKERTKRTEEGCPVHSFQTLLADLGTLAKNRIRIPEKPNAEFSKLTQPTPLQAKAFALLGITLRP